MGDEVSILLFARVKTGLYIVANTIFAEENFSKISQFPWQLASVLGENLVLKAIIRYRASVRDALVYRKFVKNFAAKIYFQATRLIKLFSPAKEISLYIWYVKFNVKTGLFHTKEQNGTKEYSRGDLLFQ